MNPSWPERIDGGQAGASLENGRGTDLRPSKIARGFRPGRKPVKMFWVPRWMAVILALFTWLILIPFAHGVIPWAVSTLMPRYGWEEGFPGIWNRFGLMPVAAGAALLIWILVLGIARTPDRVKVGLDPPFLMMRGPYRFTRNPMYIAELGLWLGWSLFFGSPCVFIGCLVFLCVVILIVLPREERGLEAAFGQAYLQYKNRVPRWLGKINPKLRPPRTAVDRG